MGRLLALVLATIAALCLLTAPAALAGQEFGDRCIADDSESDWTAIALNNSLFFPELPVEVPPEGAKVITRWKVDTAPGTPPTQQQLLAFKQVGEEDDRLVGESAVETLVAGHNEFATRIPVPEYGHIGLRGPVETLFCDKLSTHVGGIVEGPWAVGEQRHFKVSVGVGVPAVAVVERDGDGDGYGDETQDGCGDNPLVHDACPIFGLRVAKEVRPGTILIRVTPSAVAQVSVDGEAHWQLKPKRARGGGRRLLTVGLDGESERTVDAGTQAVFRLPLGRTVLRRLSRIPPAQGVRMRVVVRAAYPFGEHGGHVFRFRLPGRAD